MRKCLTILRAAASIAAMSYCNRYIDDYPGMRAECEGHIRSGRKCTTCPNRDTDREVRDLRAKLKRLDKAQAGR